MTEPPQPPQSVIATVTGRELLDRLDTIALSFAGLAAKLDDVPARLKAVEGKNYVTWGQLGAVLTLFVVALGVVAAFLALR